MTNEIRKSNDETRKPQAPLKRLGFRNSGFFRHSSVVIRQFTLLLCASAVFAQKPADRPAPLDPVQGEREARVLVAELLSQQPDQNATNTGRLIIRDADGNQRELRVRFELLADGANTLSIYEATAPDGRAGGARLTVIQSAGKPNQYQLAEEPGPGLTNVSSKTLSGKEAMVPFAGSDFWLADLGLEFLHWPQQRVLYKEMRHSQSCARLESINPNPAPGGYARVESWIDLEAPHGVVHADAFDANRKRIKQFDPKSVKKIQGQYQLEAMEMLNEKTGSRTVIKFDLKRE
jgi:hypothetical protein